MKTIIIEYRLSLRAYDQLIQLVAGQERDAHLHSETLGERFAKQQESEPRWSKIMGLFGELLIQR